MTSKLGKREGIAVNREEVLAKSRAENQNKDIYSAEVIKQGAKAAMVVQMAVAAVFFVGQLLAGRGVNWGLWARVYSGEATLCWVKYAKLRRGGGLWLALGYTLLVVVMGSYYMAGLFVSCPLA